MVYWFQNKTNNFKIPIKYVSNILILMYVQIGTHSLPKNQYSVFEWSFFERFQLDIKILQVWFKNSLL